MRGVGIIFRKELLEVLRDKRTLIFMIVLPIVVLPLIFNMVFDFMQKQEKKAAKETLSYALINGENFPEFVNYLNADEGFELNPDFTTEDQIVEAIKAGDLKMGLVVPEDVQTYLDAGYALDITLIYNNASLISRVESRTRTLLNGLNEELRKTRLSEVGLISPLKQEGVMEPARLVKTGIASKREILGENIGGFLPYLFVVFCFMGAFYPAIDIGAGEKERGTLETLLLTPVPRSSLVLGKFLVIFLSGVTAAIFCLASIAGWVWWKGDRIKDALGEVIQSIDAVDIGMIFLMILPTAALFAAIMLSISIFAKTFKEAQNYIAPLQFLLILPAFMAFLPGITLNWKTAMVPITNISLAIKEIAKGTVDYTLVGIIFASTVALAGLATFFCVKWFQREDVLFRS